MSGLEERVQALEEALAHMTEEVRTRRLVVVDEAGAERISTTVTTDRSELMVAGVGADGEEAAAVISVDGPGPDTMGGASVDILVMGGGNVVGHLNALEASDWAGSLSLTDVDGENLLQLRPMAD